MVIKSIIERRKNTYQYNVEDIATQAIKANQTNSDNVNEWYRAVIRLCSELCEKLDVNYDSVLGNLGSLQKKHLSLKITELTSFTSQLNNKLY